MTNFHLGIIGGGNMAEAIVRGALSANFLNRSDIVISDVNYERRRKLADLTGVRCANDNLLSAGCPVLLLAVKPQMIGPVLDEIATTVQPSSLVISIAAGVTTKSLDQKLATRGRIVRAMPNTPMLVGQGTTAICAGPRATAQDLAWANDLFAASGQVCNVDENMMDAVTAVSGSGPAYFFYLIEAMIQAGVAEGLSEEVAARLAVGTCAGAAKLLQTSGETPQALRAKVTSPNGTTQRAIETMDAAEVKPALIKAIRAAAQRSRELGK